MNDWMISPNRVAPFIALVDPTGPKPNPAHHDGGVQFSSMNHFMRAETVPLHVSLIQEKMHGKV